jgi:hypothetical protein
MVHHRTRKAVVEQECLTEASRALAVNSCTAGLHLTRAALDLPPGHQEINEFAAGRNSPRSSCGFGAA